MSKSAAFKDDKPTELGSGPTTNADVLKALVKLLPMLNGTVLQTGREAGPTRVSIPKTLPPDFEAWVKQLEEPLSEEDVASLQAIGERVARPFFDRRYGAK